MIKVAKELTRTERKRMKSFVRGIYQEENDDMFDSFLIRYPAGVITLETALSFYGMIDEWICSPYCFNFQTGYRKIDDDHIKQFRDDKEILKLGCVKEKHNGIIFNIFDKERLLIELWRKEKYIQKDIYKQAIFAYRQLANSGNLNIPLLKQYISKMPKSNIYLSRLSLEVL